MQIRLKGMTPSTIAASEYLHSFKISMCQPNQSHPILQYQGGAKHHPKLWIAQKPQRKFDWVSRHDTPFCTLITLPSLHKWQMTFVWIKPQLFKSCPTSYLCFAIEKQRQISIWCDGKEIQICISAPYWIVVQFVYKTVGQVVLLLLPAVFVCLFVYFPSRDDQWKLDKAKSSF